MIHVCPMSRLLSLAQRIGATHLVTLLTEGSVARRPESIVEAHHLHLTMHDIASPRDGMTAPDSGHLRMLLDYLTKWDQSTPLIFSCYAGISRSTSAAYVAWCALSPDRDELEMAKILRERSPGATPNPLIISIGDELLDRNGRMSAAISSIGRGADAYEGNPFCLDLPES